MKKKPLSSVKYSVIEIALCGQNLRAKEKVSARDLLLSCRIPERSLVCSDYKGVFRLCCYTRSAKNVREVRTKCTGLKDRPFVLKVKKLGQHDWFDKWKRDYHIKPLGAKFMIVPVWEKRKLKSGRRVPIFLEPGSAFGSGYHETTRLMIRLLESLKGKIGSFLDIGCGTGILSVAAAKLGAGKITGYDNDKPSALVAAKNFRINQCEGGTFFFAQLKRSKVSGTFDTVGANLLSRVLLEYRSKIIARVGSGGFLLVSGIARQNFSSFKTEFFGTPLKCLKILRGRRWVAVLFKK
ncbi:MAG TPA: 50S ribosomal protein L11 methyltransferase [Candidatus Omnitrophota bacterium]|nr:50S ribosomal protein L11 methyltransferase [Candidatus Omnitrophota bacterium]